MILRKVLPVLALMFISSVMFGQSPIGTWKTIDDGSGEEKSYVEIYEKDGKLFGKIVKLLRVPEDKVCDECSGSRKDQPLMGMNIIENLEKDGDDWEDGEIMDPENGKTYRCKIWVDGDTGNLKVKGIHWTGLSRTQTWYRVK